MHLHGLLMFAWMALLIAQAALIRAGHRALHRSLGRVSYGLAPLAVFVALQAPTFVVFREPWWAAFAHWLAKLPLP